MTQHGDNDPSLSITLPLEVFATAISIFFFLGGCIGFVLGKRKYRKDVSSSREYGVRDVKGTSRQQLDEPSLKKPDDDENDDQQQSVIDESIKNDDKQQEEEEEDGPTMVLRGSLDLMASKWGIAKRRRSATKPAQSHCDDDDARSSSSSTNHESTTPSSSSSSAVVEYLSPEKMTQLLFSKINREGDNVSQTLCLDEYHHGSGEKDSRLEVPSPKSSTTDIVNLLTSSKTNNKNDNKSDETTSKDETTTITPAAFLNLLSLIQKYSVDTSHPYFFNQLFGSLDPIALAAEIVALSVNTSAYTYETAPVFTLLEREVMGQIGRLVFFGHEETTEKLNNQDGEKEEEFEGEGLMIPGGSLANLTAMHAARHRWKAMNGYTTKQTQTMEDSRRLMVEEEQMGEVQQHYWSSSLEDGEEEKKLEVISSHGAPSSLSQPQNNESHTSTSQQQQQQSVYDDNRSTPDLVAFVSSEAHYSFSKSARVLGLREDDLIVIPTHADGRMDVAVLAKRIEELEMLEPTAEAATDKHCGRRKRVPFFVACTAGSTVRGSFDDIASIVKVCRSYESRNHRNAPSNSNHHQRSIWVHVDGAWGGSAIFSARPSVRRATHVDDIRHADSFTFNPHKMLGAPQQTTAFIVRHRHALRDANAAGAKYLFDPRKNGAEYDLGDLSYTCGRRTDAVKLWALWK
eukprot:CAMPEP_0201994646 /NCGR_PEP_ID=MMETSP0905-20130828/2415_1 /ASSEMBLY_ACC=CAM_ASM_000554 /TAXON_ID=420261 /ORGANISM="Thalassiosira antarctica, Strain CCMP982" /LENGTH=684 /DNA_ID=CAMNT_0048549659 /DNA_START=126 /DNA_END=2177 /DNA_ORIENTATION=-